MFINPLNLFDNINHNVIANAMNGAAVRALGVVKVMAGLTILVAPPIIGSKLILSGAKQAAEGAEELRTWYNDNCYEENSRVTIEDWQCKVTTVMIGAFSPIEDLYKLCNHYFD